MDNQSVKNCWVENSILLVIPPQVERDKKGHKRPCKYLTCVLTQYAGSQGTLSRGWKKDFSSECLFDLGLQSKRLFGAADIFYLSCK